MVEYTTLRNINRGYMKREVCVKKRQSMLQVVRELDAVTRGIKWRVFLI